MLNLTLKEFDTIIKELINAEELRRESKNIFANGELDEKVVISKMKITTQHGAIEGITQIFINKRSDFYEL